MEALLYAMPSTCCDQNGMFVFVAETKFSGEVSSVKKRAGFPRLGRKTITQLLAYLPLRDRMGWVDKYGKGNIAFKQL